MNKPRIIYDGPIVKWSDAKRLGLKRYFTGKVCVKGLHVDEKLVNSRRCLSCNRDRSRAARGGAGLMSDKFIGPIFTAYHGDIVSRAEAKNGGMVRYFTGKPCSRGHIAQKRARNGRCVMCANAEKKNQSIEIKKKAVTHQRNRRSASGRHTYDDVLSILSNQNGTCVYCGVSINENYHVDHIMPIALGGSNNPDNLQCLCPSCNLRKHAKHPDKWHDEIGYEKQKRAGNSGP